MIVLFFLELSISIFWWLFLNFWWFEWSRFTVVFIFLLLSVCQLSLSTKKIFASFFRRNTLTCVTPKEKWNMFMNCHIMMIVLSSFKYYLSWWFISSPDQYSILWYVCSTVDVLTLRYINTTTNHRLPLQNGSLLWLLPQCPALMGVVVLLLLTIRPFTCTYWAKKGGFLKRLTFLLHIDLNPCSFASVLSLVLCRHMHGCWILRIDRYVQ